jgi:tetratricopeptide (TPR) repeat protein
LAPERASGYESRGLVYLRLNRLDEAITDYNAALKINGKLSRSLYGRGLAKLRKGDRSSGAADVSAAKVVNSDIVAEFTEYGLK